MFSARFVFAMVTVGWLLFGHLRADTVILPQIADGPHWRTTIRIINLFRNKQELTLSFSRSNGRPWVDIAWWWRFTGSLEPDANGKLTIRLEPGEVYELRSFRQAWSGDKDEDIAGYLTLNANAEVTKVSAFLTYYEDGRPGTETARVGVQDSPIATWVSLPFDEETGVAVVNTGTKPISLQFSLAYTDIFGPDKTRIFDIDLEAGEHSAFFLKERVNEKSSVTNDYFGYLYMWTEDGADPFAAMGLIFRDDGVMTSLPVHVIRTGPF